MATIGIDLGKVNSQVSERDEVGKEVLNRRLNTRKELIGHFRERPRCRVLIESCTLARWVVNELTLLGHEVKVADPNYLPMYVDRSSKRKKTDKRDASLLSLALHENNWRAAHLRGESAQLRKCLVDARARLVRGRTKHINGVRASLLQWGVMLPMTEAGDFEAKAAGVMQLLPEELREVLKFELGVLRKLSQTIAKMDKRLASVAKDDPDARILMSHPAVGPVTALAFTSVVDDPNRFGDGHELGSFLGLVPREASSGEKRVLGRITKTGPAYLRGLLVQIAWGIWRSKNPDAARQKEWAQRIAARRGKQVAVVALARKIAGTLLSMWKHGRAFDVTWSQPRHAAAA